MLPVRWLYNLLVRLAAPVVLLVEAWRGLRDPAWRGRWRERLGLGAGGTPGGIWVHAVSVGEVQAAAPLVRALRSRHPERLLVLTTVTPTGAARARSLFGDSVDLRYAPLDLPGAARRFLDRVRPCLAVFVETELWPNLLEECRRRDIPRVLASARISPRSAARYRHMARLLRGPLAHGTVVAAQSAADLARLRAIGAAAGRSFVTGNVKFDVELEPGLRGAGAAWRASQAPDRPVWVAGSTRAGEEETLLDAQALLAAQLPGTLLVLVPRHPQRFEEVAALLERRGLRWSRRSAGGSLAPGTQVLLGDTMGELPLFYAAGDVAFVGGSLVPAGGHNLLEPAALGLPIVTGPHHFNGQEIHDKLAAAGALSTVTDAPALAAELARLLPDRQARREQGARGLAVVAANRGAVARLLELVEGLLGAGAAAAATRPEEPRGGY